MKRWGMRIGISTLLGLLTTIGVAWLCARYVRPAIYDEYAAGMTASSSGWFLRAYRRAGVEYVTGSPPADVMDRWLPAGAFDDLLEPDEVSWMGEYTKVAEAAPGDLRRTQVVNVRGWPLPAFFCVLTETTDGGRRVIHRSIDGGIVTEPEQRTQRLTYGADWHALTIPLRPIWLSLAGDVAFYGAIWCTLLSMANLLRRRIRYVSRRVIAVSVGVSFVGGVISTLGVSWFCAFCIDLNLGVREHGWGRSSGGPVSWSVRRSAGPSAIRFRSDWWSRGGLASTGPGPDGPVEDFLPDWTDYLSPGDDDSIGRVLEARGWPMLAMWGGFEVSKHVENQYYVDTLGETRHAIVFPRYYENRLDDDWSRVIPLAPIWPGFAVNTLLYSSVWLVILLICLGPGVIKRTYRHRCGRCLRCGYDLRGSAPSRCPECGLGGGAAAN